MLVILSWPFWALLIALRTGRRRYACWNNLIDNLTIVISEPKTDYSTWREPLSSISFYIPLLYVCSRTGIYLPDEKNETDKYCRQFGIATPRVYSLADAPLPPGEYVVKPIRGSSAKGIVFISDPEPYLADKDLIVQEVLRNPLEQRRIWGSEALASIRCFTVTTTENTREIAGAVLRIPMNGGRFDNTTHGNGYARVDRDGWLERAYTDNEFANGFSFHPLTNERIEGVRLEHFAECIQLAIRTHEALAAELPVLNSDIALTEQGPMLIEINRAPGQYWNMYRDGFSEKCVAALCRGIARAARQSVRPRSGLLFPAHD
ncbi:MAG: sugar-transfer associated ATP-grasp domain-containing protein, partial [Pirellulales bacterium]